MLEPSRDESDAKPTNADVVTTKVNVAFPFSTIKVEEPSEELAALAVLLCELADLMAEIAPESKAPELAQRAQALASRLK